MISKKFIVFLSFLSIQPFYGVDEPTSLEAIRADCYKALTALLEQISPADCAAKGQLDDMATVLSYGSVDPVSNFINEPGALTQQKRTFIAKAHQEGILIRVTPTDAMLMSYDSDIKSYLQSNIQNYPKLLPLLTQLIEKENEELSKNNHIFYHGLRKDIYMNMYIHTKILELISPINPHFLMLRSPVSDYSPAYLPSILRTHFLSNGSKAGDWCVKDRYHLLSTNHSIFGNFYRPGSCTLSYFLNNHSCGEVAISYESLFSHYGLEDVYKKYAQALEELTINSPSGILLQLSLADRLTQKVCYLSIGGGYKTTLSNKRSFFSWTRNQNDREQIITKPGSIDDLNRREWRLVLTDDLLLNPHNQDLRITAYTLEQESLTEFHTKVDAIFESIKKELTQQKRTVVKPVKKGWSTNRLTWPLQKLHINDCLPYQNTKRSHIIPSIISTGLLATCLFLEGQVVYNMCSRNKHLTHKQEIQKIALAAIAWFGAMGIEFMMKKNII